MMKNFKNILEKKIKENSNSLIIMLLATTVQAFIISVSINIDLNTIHSNIEDTYILNRTENLKSNFTYLQIIILVNFFILLGVYKTRKQTNKK